jgi:transaldolase
MTPNSNLKQLHDVGVSIWLDTLSRELLSSGGFGELISDSSVTGATSNPTIFAKAITGSDLYDEQLRALAEGGQRDLKELYFAVALDDVRWRRESCDPASRKVAGATASSPSSARPTSRTTPPRPSSRPPTCGNDWRHPT